MSRRSRLKKSTLFELDEAPGLTEVCDEYLQLAEQLWAGTDPLPCEPMKDRDLFDFWDLIDGISELPNAPR